MVITKRLGLCFSLFVLLFVIIGCDVILLDFARKPDIDQENPYFTVIFNPSGGTGGGIREVLPDNTVSNWPPEPLWPGGSRVFHGWFTEDDQPFGRDDAVRGDMTVYAYWFTAPPAAPRVTFDRNYDSGMGREAYPRVMAVTMAGAALSWLPDPPTRSGFIFDGWNTQANGGGTPFNAGTSVPSNMNVYAQWIPLGGTGPGTGPASFMVVFDLQGGSGAGPLFRTANAASNWRVSSPAAPERRGYDFDKWYYDDPSTGERPWNFGTDEVEEDITLFAKWEMREYTLVYNENNGEALSRSVMIMGIQYDQDLPINDITNVNPDISPPIIFIPPTVDHVFLNWNTEEPLGSPPANPEVTRFYPGQALDIIPGWGGADLIINLYAHWLDTSISGPTFTVSFNINGGDPATQPAPLTGIAEDATISAPTAPTRTGYSFTGWHTVHNPADDTSKWAFDGDTDPTEVKGNTVLFARWQIRTYDVAYNANHGSLGTPGGSTAGTTSPIEYNELITIASNGFTLAGQRFLYWNTEPVDTESDPAPATRFFPGQSVVNLPGFDDDLTGDPPIVTLYAQWGPAIYTVTFNSNQGSPVGSVTRTHGDVLGTIANPARAGYSFAGWRDIDDDLWTASSPVTKNITLYAQWTLAMVTVTFDANGGTPASRTQDYLPGSTIPAAPLPEPGRTGRSFLGWWRGNGAGGEWGTEWVFGSSGTSGVSVLPTDTTSPFILYARWNDVPDGLSFETAFLVQNAAELQMVGKGTDNTNSDYHEWTLDKFYRQTANIPNPAFTGDAMPASFDPIGSSGTGNSFTGGYDGGGFYIEDLAISSGADYTGLFGHITGATIKNLGLRNLDINGSDYTGGLAGQASGSSHIFNCYVQGGSLSGSITVGGLVGYINGNSLLENSYADVTVTASGINAGGLVGYASGTGTINSSYALGNVTGSSNVGGLVGQSASGTSITNSVALNPRITRTDETSGVTYGRIAGIADGALSGNRARNMLINGSAEYLTNQSGQAILTGRHGATIVTHNEANRFLVQEHLDVMIQGWWTGFDFTGTSGSDPIWIFHPDGTTANHTLPTLRNAGSNQNPRMREIGMGIEQEPFLVYDIPTLQRVGTEPPNPSGLPWTLAAHYLQVANIELDTVPNFTPIGVRLSLGDEPFTGVYDGGHHTISDLSITRTVPYTGLFYLIGGSGTVRKLGLLNVDISGITNTGSLAGRNNGSIENCYATGEVSASDGFVNALGGLVGLNTGTIRESYVNMTSVIAPDTAGNYVGGLVGSNQQGGYIIDSYAAVEVVRGFYYVGGLVGENAAGGSIIEFTYATARIVSGSNTRFGGIAGNNAGTLRHSAALNPDLQLLTGSLGSVPPRRVTSNNAGTLTNNWGRLMDINGSTGYLYVLGSEFINFTGRNEPHGTHIIGSGGILGLMNSVTLLPLLDLPFWSNYLGVITTTGPGFDISNTGTESTWVFSSGRLPYLRFTSTPERQDHGLLD